MRQMPVLFVGHGSPMNALAKNAFSESLYKLGATLPKPQAVLCVSAHWETQGTQVLYNAAPPTIHDFYGFPKPLFDLQYPARGPLGLAHETQKLLPQATLNEKWGLDHGTWSVLVHMYPHADIPVFQVSLDINKTPTQHLEMGRQLRSLREKGILILGSGNIVHNLATLNWHEPTAAYPWAQEFDLAVKKALEERDEVTLTNFEEKIGAASELAVPTPEHYLPLLYCLGASQTSDAISYPYEGYEMGSLSMRSVLWS
ncbi:MAG: 4,5-DOPA dioxygenase extradiol [Bdellovibrio sp.]|nr:4,5-DOPA dioxygenase extradiol [Bdellovibrio sp.]